MDTNQSHYYGQFALSLGKESPHFFPKFKLLNTDTPLIPGLRSNRAQWPLAPNICSQATRKSYFFHTSHMLGILEFPVSAHWAPFVFP